VVRRSNVAGAEDSGIADAVKARREDVERKATDGVPPTRRAIRGL
jgi:hypothetical protein